MVKGLASTGLVNRFPYAAPHEAIVKRLPRLDVDGFELSIGRVWDLSRVEHDLGSAGLRFATAHADKRIGAELLDDSHAALAELERNCRVAAALGAQTLDRDDRCHVTLDTEFLARHGQLEAALEADALWEHVAHVHVKDYADALRDGDVRRRYLIPGEGNIDFDQVFDALRARRYEGALTLEISAVDSGGNIHEQRFREAAARLGSRPWLLPV